MNLDRLKYRYWQHTDWHDDNSPLEAVYCNAVDGCDPTIAVSDFEFCTGLKDKNRNLIYEGDIVKGRYFNPYHSDTPNPEIEGVVCFVENRMVWIVENGDEGYDFEDCMEEYFEIIGNIHEQAEQKDK